MDRHESFKPRPAFTIDWHRPYDSGPSDAHLHAMGQFIANYSAVEWKISELFAVVLGKAPEEVHALIVETNMPMSGMVRYTKQRLQQINDTYRDSAEDLVFTIEAFEQISKIRHKIVHWQWGLDEGDDATLTDFIKTKSSGKSTASLPLGDLRNYCFYLMKIFQALILGTGVISGQCTRQQILEARRETSAEKLFRP